MRLFSSCGETKLTQEHISISSKQPSHIFPRFKDGSLHPMSTERDQARSTLTLEVCQICLCGFQHVARMGSSAYTPTRLQSSDRTVGEAYAKAVQAT